MKQLLAILLLLFSTSVLAELKFESSVGHIVLHEKPCTEKEVTQYIKPEALPLYKEAHIVYLGESFKACYREVDEDTIFIVDEVMDTGEVPKNLFKENTI